MRNFINKFKMPTILGLGIIFLGLASGVYLVLKDQVLLSQAAPNIAPQNVTFSNITDTQTVVSWQTNSPVPSFITFGQESPTEQTALDDRDTSPNPHLIHYATLKNLLPKTKYQLKIVSGKNTSAIFQFETSAPLTSQTEFTPIIGSVINGNMPLDEGVIYLSLSEATTQSALIKKGGSFLIPISQIAKADLSNTFTLVDDMPAKLTVHSASKETSIQFTLKAGLAPIPPIILGQNIDLTTANGTPQPKSDSSQASLTINDLNKYDLNNDGKINAADNAIILLNFGKNPKNKKTDLNGDGKVDQKDLDLISQELKDLGSQ
jgi:hypothetical protein